MQPLEPGKTQGAQPGFQASRRMSQMPTIFSHSDSRFQFSYLCIVVNADVDTMKGIIKGEKVLENG